jgi:hypothetical protein
MLVERNQLWVGAIQHWSTSFGKLSAGMTMACVAGAGLTWWASGRIVRHVRVKWRRTLILGMGGLLAAMFLFPALQVAGTIVEQEEARWALALWLMPTLAFIPYFVLKLLPQSRLLDRWAALDINQPHPIIVVFGLSAAVLLGFGLQALPLMTNEAASANAAIYTTIIYVIYLPALGATMRFLSEKMALQAEALSYRDAYCWYVHAEQLLRGLKLDQGNSAADERARDVVRALGKLALKENETWLKARRQRPLSPLI